MDKMNSLLYIFPIISCLFQSGVSANSMISCPATFLKEEPSNLKLSIDNSTFSVCDIQPTTVNCRWFPENAAMGVICSGSVTRCEKDVTIPRCPCVNESALGYEYNIPFSMLPNQEKGNISCDLDCTVLTPGGATATVDAGPSCQNVYFVSRCVASNPCSLGVCRIDTNGDAVCDCTGTGLRRPICEVVNDFVIGLICVSILLVVILAVIAGFILKACTVPQTSNIRLVSNNQRETNLLTATDTKVKIRNFIQQNFSRCCCFPIRVEMDVFSLDGGHVLIALKSKLVWFLRLRGMPAKVEQFINRDILRRIITGGTVNSNVHAADNPPESQKSNSNSERLQMEDTR